MCNVNQQKLDHMEVRREVELSYFLSLHYTLPLSFKPLTVGSIRLFRGKSSITVRAHLHRIPHSNFGDSPNPVFSQPA